MALRKSDAVAVIKAVVVSASCFLAFTINIAIAQVAAPPAKRVSPFSGLAPQAGTAGQNSAPSQGGDPSSGFGPFPSTPAGQAPKAVPESQPQIQPSAPAQIKAPEQEAPQVTQQPQPAETAVQPTEPVEPNVEPRKEPATRQGALRRAAGGTLSFFFDDADIYEVIQTIFGDVLRSNYIIDPKVKGRVNFRTITPIPKEEVLTIMEIIFRLNGVGFVEEKGLYRIVPLTDVPLELVRSQTGKSPDDVAMEMFTFKNLNLKDAMQDIEGAIGLSLTEGKARVLPIYRLNSLLVIAASKSELDYVRKWIEVFDTMFANARQKIYVYPLQNTKAAHLSSMLQSIFGGGAGAGAPKPATPTPAPTPATPARPGAAQPGTPPAQTGAPKTGAAATITGSGSLISEDTKIFADEIANSLIILATPTDYAFIEETIKKIDISPRQVLVEAYLIAVDLSDNLSLGFAWSLTTDINFTMKPFTNPINLAGNLYQQPPKLDTSVSDQGFTFVATDPSGIVRAKVIASLQDFKGKVLASPHVLVSDNREARIQVGQQVPIATSQTASPIGTGSVEVPITNTTTSTIQYKDIGIILKIKPQINDSGLISLELSQEVSKLGEAVVVAGVLNRTIDKTEATTNLVARDGETIIIGGLIREDESKTKTGIPVLSQIPIIGSLFANTSNDSRRSELIMLLTPHVMRNQAEAQNLTLDYIKRYNRTLQDRRVEDFVRERSEKQQTDEKQAPPK